MQTVQVKIARTKQDSESEGIHLSDPTKSELQGAIQEAEVKGFSTVWIESNPSKGE